MNAFIDSNVDNVFPKLFVRPTSAGTPNMTGKEALFVITLCVKDVVYSVPTVS
jgi:hypothetical protein